MAADDRPYKNTVAVLATMHGKERAIGPVLEQGLGLRVALAMGLDTDRFGTFSREVERTGSQLDAARAKIAEGFEYAPYARVGLASEGSFGPHPYIPFLAVGRELVLLIDRERGLELAGCFASPETNYGHAVVPDMKAATAFAARSKFPEHGLIVMGCINAEPAPGLALFKDVVDHAALEDAVGQVVAKCGAAFVEADMRAHRNPTRMRAVERAAGDLVRRFRNRCPACAHPGFDVTERTGLPCEGCGLPTHVVRLEVLTCSACAYREARFATSATTADTQHCESCNP
ncbi:DUF6671 family protein [Phenylobacterium sp.]|uniref:DUF6671 family protein n=1 Tax=Phenylobacterium sp. TaxID=1871053 RepID=UPI002869F502|nr:DUF6671 family protein [Phenylobacterium sp.]